MVQSLAVGHSSHEGQPFCSPLVLYFYFDKGLNQGGVWGLVFIPDGAFLTWFL